MEPSGVAASRPEKAPSAGSQAKARSRSKAQDFLGRCADFLCGDRAAGPPPKLHGFFGEGVAESTGALEGRASFVDRITLGEKAELPGDTALAALAFAICVRLERTQSGGLRSVCLLLHREDGRLLAEVGAEVEGACGCSAEASALAKFLLRRGSRGGGAAECLVVASDAHFCSGPPLPARELLAEHLDPGATRLICAWRGGPSGQELHSESHLLEALYPHPCCYRRVAAGERAAFAQRLAERCGPLPERAQEALAAAREAAGESAECAAAALMPDSSIMLCRPEEQPLPDSMVRLVSRLAVERGSDCPPTLLLCCDRYGLLHAPSGLARSCLDRAGFGDVEVLLHDEEKGELSLVTVQQLLGAASRPPTADGEEAEEAKPAA